MRVIEPGGHHSQAPQHPTPKRVRYILVFLILVGGGFGLWYFMLHDSPTPSQNRNAEQNSNASAEPARAAKKGTLKTFTPQQFRELYNTFAYPNTERISDKTPITGNKDADDHIRAMAEGRGYVLRSAPVTDVFVDVAPDMRLQQRAAADWIQLRDVAQKDGIKLGLSAAYRSADEQSEIFTSRLTRAGVNLARVSSGAYDSQIATVLETTAAPGYSRHHTGYTVDITCQQQPGATFIDTKCFQWLSADNYKNAKSSGWIPSYPEGTGAQGPEPEAWEYVWVGLDAVTD